VLHAGAGDEGSASDRVDLFDPKSRAWSRGAPLAVARKHHASTVLADGRVLVCGGEEVSVGPSGISHAGAVLASCELYDPTTNKWSGAPPMSAKRARFTLTTLVDGRALAVGDPGAELFDAAKAKWEPAPAPSVAYVAHTATLLPDGRVVVIGANVAPPVKAAIDVFDPKAGTWTAEAPPQMALTDHSATLLDDGSVLVVGGVVASAAVQSGLAFAAVYEPKRRRWDLTGQPHAPHWRHAALALPSGDVLVAGGEHEDAELYHREIWIDPTPDLTTRLDQLRMRDAPAAGGPGR
jgi:hypothetical protein